ncbi:MAG: polysaccharide biosynthesis/export family protein [Planctomycetes bacterium]|nr:polysaccharide biosynthesis/export family protein [Planctomycetota bacterium]
MLLAGLLGLAGCAGSGTVSGDTCPEPAASSQEYVIGAGDELEIFVWREPDLSGTIPVRADGKISISLVEDMVAVGKTPTELARDMEVVLAEYLRLPKVNIIVTSEGSANQIQVIGNVVTPQSIPYRDNIRILDVVVAVGGLDEFAAGNRAKVVRTIDGVTTECRVRLNDLLRDGDMSINMNMYPGDVLIVPESRF